MYYVTTKIETMKIFKKTILQTSETRGKITHLFIDWDEWGCSWATSEVIELDIQRVRDNTLKELGI